MEINAAIADLVPRNFSCPCGCGKNHGCPCGCPSAEVHIDNMKTSAINKLAIGKDCLQQYDALGEWKKKPNKHAY